MKSNGIASRQLRDAAGEGARNLLHNCVNLSAGDRLLIVGEDGPEAFYDKNVCDIIAHEAKALGAETEILIAPITAGPEDFPDIISNAMLNANGTVFLSRIGDQLRFSKLPGSGSKTMCCLPDISYLADTFARSHYQIIREVEAKVSAKLRQAGSYQITCPLGTDLTCEMPAPDHGSEHADARFTPFRVAQFPVMIFAPVCCAAMSGQLALSKWLTSSSTHVIKGSALHLNDVVMANIENGQITGFDGPADETAKVQQHFERVGELVGGNPMAVNSWHTGVNPRAFFIGNPSEHVEFWGDVAYGSPRFTHFHACGADPGDVAITLIDATVAFDGEIMWQDGKFVFIDTPEMRAIARHYDGSEEAFEMRWDIGV